MSKFHEIIKELLEDVQIFLSTTLASESISATAISRKESLLIKLSKIRDEYPQLQIHSQSQPPKEQIKNIQVQVVPMGNASKQGPASPGSPPPYFDMQSKNPSPILAQKVSSIPTNYSEEYEEYEGNSDIVIVAEGPKSLADLDNTLVLDESLKEIVGVSAAELKTSEKNGYLEKKGKERLGGLLSPFQKRWCAIRDGIMYIFEGENDKKQKSHIDLFGYEGRAAPTACKDPAKKNLSFELVCPGKRTYQFIALTTKDLKQWLAAIDKNNTLINETNVLPTPKPLNESPYKKESAIKKLLTSPSKMAAATNNKVESSTLAAAPPPLPPPSFQGHGQIESDSEDIYEPVDELDRSSAAGIITEPLYEEGEMLSDPQGDEELYVDGGEHPPELPSVQVEPIEPELQADFNPSDWYVALWDNREVTDPTELKFSRGDLMKIIDKRGGGGGGQWEEGARGEAGDDWWTAQLRNKMGFVPKIYLMEAYEPVF